MKKFIYILSCICTFWISLVGMHQLFPQTYARSRGTIVKGVLLEKKGVGNGFTDMYILYNGKKNFLSIEDTIQNKIGDTINLYYWHGKSDIFFLQKETNQTFLLDIFIVLMFLAGVYILMYIYRNWKNEDVWKSERK